MENIKKYHKKRLAEALQFDLDYQIYLIKYRYYLSFDATEAKKYLIAIENKKQKIARKLSI